MHWQTKAFVGPNETKQKRTASSMNFFENAMNLKNEGESIISIGSPKIWVFQHLFRDNCYFTGLEVTIIPPSFFSPT